MTLPKVIGNKEFFRAHKSLYMRVQDGRCPICNSTITNHDYAGEKLKPFTQSGLCTLCGRMYGNNLGRALRKYENNLWREKCEDANIQRSLGVSQVEGSKMKGKKLPFKIPDTRIYTPKVVPSYVIENREISRPPAPKYTPNQVSQQRVRKYLADKEAGII